MKKFLLLAKWILALVAVLALLAVLAVTATGTGAFDDYLRGKIVAAAAENGMTLEISEFDFDPYGPSVTAKSVKAYGPDKSWTAVSGRVRITLDIVASFYGAPAFGVEIEEPKIEGEVKGDEKKPEGGAGPDLPDFRLRKIGIKGGSLDLSIPGRDLKVSFAGLNVDWLETNGRGRIEKGLVTWHGETEELLELTFEGERKTGQTRVEPLVMRTTRATLNGKLKIGLMERLGGDFNLRLDLRDVPPAWLKAAKLNGFGKAGGYFEILGQFAGSLSSPEINMMVDMTDGRFGEISSGKIAGRIEVGKDRAEFRKLAVSTSAGSLKDLDGTLSWAKEVTIKANAEVENYDLRKSMALLDMEHFPVGLAASGRISAKGRLYPGILLDCRGEDLEVRDLDVSTLEGAKSHTWYSLERAKVDFSAKVTGDHIDFGKCLIDSDSVTVKIKEGRIDYDKGLEYETDVVIRNLSTVKRYLPEGFDAAGEASGKFGGPFSALKFAYDLDLNEAKVFGYSLGKVRGAAEYDLETLKTEGLRVEGPVGEVKISGQAALVHGGKYDLALSASNGSVPELARFISLVGDFALPASFTGEFDWEGRVSGELSDPVFKGDMAAKALGVGKVGWWKGAVADFVEGSCTFGLTRWSAEGLKGEANGTRFTAKGFADLERMDISGSFSAFELSNLKRYADLNARSQGLFSGDYVLRGPYDALEAEAKGRLEKAVFMETPLGDMETGIRRVPGALYLTGAKYGGLASYSANIGDDGHFSVDLTLNGYPYADFPAKYLPEGFTASRVRGKGRLEGIIPPSGGDAEITAGTWDGTAEDVYYLENSLGGVSLKAGFSPDDKGAVSIEAGLWAGEARVFTHFSPKDRFSPTVGLDLKKLNLTRLAKTASALESGEIDLKAVVTLDAMPPRSGDVKGIMREVRALNAMGSVRNLKVRSAPFIKDATFTATISEDGWVFMGDGPPFTKVQGHLNTGDFSWRVSTWLEKFDPMEYLPDFRNDLAVRISGKAAINGLGLKVTSFSGTGVFSDMAVYGVGPRTGRWSFDSKPGAGGEKGDAQFSLDFGSGMTANGTFNAVDGVMNARVDAVTAPIEDWLPKKALDMGIKGSVTGGADIAMQRDGSPSVKARVTRVEFFSPKTKFVNRGDIVVNYEDGLAEVARAFIEGEGYEAGISGSIRPGKSYNLKVKGTLNLGFLVKRVPHLESAEGNAEINASYSGPWGKTKLEGSMEIKQKGVVKVDKLNYPFKKISGYAEFEFPGEIRLEKLDAEFGEGKIHMEGRSNLKGFAPDVVDVFITAKNIHYEYPKGAVYDFDGEYLIAGPMDRLEIRGETKLITFSHTRQIKWRTASLSMLERARAAKVGTRETGDIYVDIAVLGNRNIKVENNIANLELASDLRVRGYLPTPELWGNLDVTGGSFRFRGREFKVLRSNIQFLGDVDPVAVLDGRAVATVGEYTVNLSASGPIEDIKVELSSVPPLSRTDIIALLALGTTTEHLENSEAVTAFEATSLLTGSLQDELEGQAYNVFGIDQFNINPSYSEQRQTTVPRITVGKAINDSLFARYGAELGSGAEQEVALEYALRPGVTFLGSWADQGSEAKGSFGAELRFRFTFR